MSRLLQTLKAYLPHARLSMLPVSLFASWCLCCGWAATGERSFTNLGYAARVPLGSLLAATALLALCLFLLGAVIPRYLYRAAPLCALFYGFVCAWRTAQMYTVFGFLILLCILLIHCLREDRMELDNLHLSRRAAAVLLIAATAAMAAYLITAALMRYLSYNSPCYDFGIFAQMFHNMSTIFQPITTCERTEEMSHFAVHMSPFFYVLLPLYMLIPRPETLLVIQVLGVLSGVIPLWLLTRHHKLSVRVGTVVCLLYICSAALTGGIFYDFHENKFLTALLLWLLWSIDRKKLPLVALFSVLALSVKEDAALYVLFIGLWLLLSRPEKKTGACMTVGAGAYFVGVTAWLSRHGDGAMFNRFDNIIGREGGIADLIRTALVNPALLLNECMNESKLVFAACILLPLGLLPLLTKKLSSLLLLCPFVIVNLLGDYTYQHQLGFQYTYGMIALMFYLTVINLSALQDLATGFRLRRFLLCFALCATALVGAVQIKNHTAVFANFKNEKRDSAAIRETLQLIPDDASVRTASMFAAHLADRRELYYLTNEVEADYVIIDLRPYINIAAARGYEVEYFERQGYELIAEVEYVIAVLKKVP